MKLDVAAVDVDVDVVVDGNLKGRRVRVGLAGIGFGLCALLAGSATALDGIDLSQPAEATAAGECPRLIQIKYPFLECANGEIGQTDADDTWANSRRMPISSDFIEGDGYWGADLNTD